MTERFGSGAIVHYPYLWKRVHLQGRQDAEKPRPVCLALVLPDARASLTHLIIVAITGTQPFEDQRAIEIPALEIRRAGLSSFKRAWLMVGEYNYDIVERSFYFDPNQQLRGRFSRQFLEVVLMEMRQTIAHKAGRVDRTV